MGGPRAEEHGRSSSVGGEEHERSSKERGEEHERSSSVGRGARASPEHGGEAVGRRTTSRRRLTLTPPCSSVWGVATRAGGGRRAV